MSMIYLTCHSFIPKFYLSQDTLFKVDKASMGVSLGMRAPFLDKDVIGFVMLMSINFNFRALVYCSKKVVL
jgi:hypothetical protein